METLKRQCRKHKNLYIPPRQNRVEFFQVRKLRNNTFSRAFCIYRNINTLQLLRFSQRTSSSNAPRWLYEVTAVRFKSQGGASQKEEGLSEDFWREKAKKNTVFCKDSSFFARFCTDLLRFAQRISLQHPQFFSRWSKIAPLFYLPISWQSRIVDASHTPRIFSIRTKEERPCLIKLIKETFIAILSFVCRIQTTGLTTPTEQGNCCNQKEFLHNCNITWVRWIQPEAKSYESAIIKQRNKALITRSKGCILPEISEHEEAGNRKDCDNNAHADKIKP